MINLPNCFTSSCAQLIKDASDCLKFIARCSCILNSFEGCQCGCPSIEALSSKLAFKGYYYNVSWITEYSTDDFLSLLPKLFFEHVMQHLSPKDRLSVACSSKFLYLSICGEAGKFIWNEGCIVSVWYMWRLFQESQKCFDKASQILAIDPRHEFGIVAENVNKHRALFLDAPKPLLSLFSHRKLCGTSISNPDQQILGRANSYNQARYLRENPEYFIVLTNRLPVLARECKYKNHLSPDTWSLFAKYGLLEACLIPFCTYYNSYNSLSPSDRSEDESWLMLCVLNKLKREHPHFNFTKAII